MCVAKHALVAQLDRAFGYEPKGRGFESLRARIKELSSESFFIGIRTLNLLRKRGFYLSRNVTFSHLSFGTVSERE